MIYTHTAVALLAAALTFAGTWKVQNWRFGAKEAARIEAEAEARRNDEKRADTASESHEKAKVKVRTEFQTIYQEVEKIVERPVYRNVCLDEDGIRLLNQAIKGAASGSQTHTGD